LGNLAIRDWKPLFAEELARSASPPHQVKMRLGMGVHLLVHGPEGGDPMHVSLHPTDAEDDGWLVTRDTCARYTGSGRPPKDHRRWLRAIRRAIRQAEDRPDWLAFLRKGQSKPGTSVGQRTEGRATSGESLLLRVHEPCNAACDFCSCIGVMPDYAVEHARIEAELDAAKARGVSSVTFTGGEPTLRRDLHEVVALATARGFGDVSLQTNAVRLHAVERVAALREAGLTSAFVSLHSHLPEVHDELLKLEGAFDKAVAGITHLLDAGILVRINHVIQQSNLGQVEAFARFVAEAFEGRAQVTFSVVSPIGWALEHLEVLPDVAQVAQALRPALEACEARDMIFDIPGLCGLPMCVLGDRLHWFSEFRDPQAPPLLETRQKFAGCESCAVNAQCSGYWKVYVERFGAAPFQPVAPEAADQGRAALADYMARVTRRLGVEPVP